jgi:hypothetical protein
MFLFLFIYTSFLSDFRKAINSDVPKTLSIDIKQEEFELAESYQQNEHLNSPGEVIVKQIQDKGKKGLKGKNVLKEEKEIHQEPQPGPSGISSK